MTKFVLYFMAVNIIIDNFFLLKICYLHEIKNNFLFVLDFPPS